MADITRRVPQNAPGKFYVDDTCIFCDLCVETAPTIYAEHGQQGWAYVLRQPQTTEEIHLATEAVEGCPTDSIGINGGQLSILVHIHTFLRRRFRK